MSVKSKRSKKFLKLEIEVEAKVFDQCLDKAFSKNRARFNIPGFRKGKAPRNPVERYWRTGLYEDAINYACADAYDKAVEENDIHPVDRPR